MSALAVAQVDVDATERRVVDEPRSTPSAVRVDEALLDLLVAEETADGPAIDSAEGRYNVASADDSAALGHHDHYLRKVDGVWQGLLLDVATFGEYSLAEAFAGKHGEPARSCITRIVQGCVRKETRDRVSRTFSATDSHLSYYDTLQSRYTEAFQVNSGAQTVDEAELREDVAGEVALAILTDRPSNTIVRSRVSFEVTNPAAFASADLSEGPWSSAQRNVRSFLWNAGIGEASWQTPTRLPLDRHAARRIAEQRASGKTPSERRKLYREAEKRACAESPAEFLTAFTWPQRFFVVQEWCPRPVGAGEVVGLAFARGHLRNVETAEEAERLWTTMRNLCRDGIVRLHYTSNTLPSPIGFLWAVKGSARRAAIRLIHPQVAGEDSYALTESEIAAIHLRNLLWSPSPEGNWLDEESVRGVAVARIGEHVDEREPQWTNTVETLFRLMDGETRTETAESLGVARSTVKRRIVHLREAFAELEPAAM